jgi:hypothetical protein
VGRVFALAEDTIAYSVGRRGGSWVSFRVRGAAGRTLTFVQLPRGGQGMFVSEDGGRTWSPPSGGAWRLAETTELTFTHMFAGDEAIFATTPPVTNTMAEAWLNEAAARLGGRLREIGRSRLDYPLRVLEVGREDGPLVFLEAGQHSMSERLGYFLITELFERAAADAELMAATRWAILPIVNVDSFTVGPPDGNFNRFWGRESGPPTIMALCRWLKDETDRTGAAGVWIDMHEGWCWRGHTLLGETETGFSDPTGNWRSLNVKRESIYPEFERCLKAEGLDYAILNGMERNRATHGRHGYFEEYVTGLRGVEVPVCLELSCIVAETERGAEPVSVENIREDARRWHRAMRRYILGRR